jgi:hypothetical protein
MASQMLRSPSRPSSLCSKEGAFAGTVSPPSAVVTGGADSSADDAIVVDGVDMAEDNFVFAGKEPIAASVDSDSFTGTAVEAEGFTSWRAPAADFAASDARDGGAADSSAASSK